ncbi:hypothetical protein Q9Q94_04605 [Uliginosibacterium sp. 31-16]|uniref:hypothetical protein n=1 Tax=Uliginosibacterium sp. 31-16 TaxID=3068315 RepID=UPI00273D4B35|nr:hypothetical protein [Uliginosibacterium sp. 31-16]MDP5238795.1 hypothetical protein [Uliginosibacterium sp. 31-16]
MGKALLTVTMFAQLPATHSNRYARSAIAYGGNGILASLERTSLRSRPTADDAVAEAAAASRPARSQAAATPAPKPASSARKGPSHQSVLPDERSEDDAVLLAILAFAESSEEKPALAHATPLARAPPQLRHVQRSAYEFHPRSRIGLFLAWATPPPVA